MTYNGFVIFTLIAHLVIGVWCARVASRKGRDSVWWFILAGHAGLLALAAVYLVSDRSSREAGEGADPTRRWLWRALAMSPSLVGLVVMFGLNAFPPGALAGLALFFGVVALSLFGMALLNLVLGAPWTPFAVARHVVAEAVSIRIVVGIIACVFLAVTAIPFALEVDRPLNYRVQMNLEFSLLCVTVLLVVMTVVLSCWTLSNEVDKSQVYITLTKPIGRGGFLLGKWLGIVLLGALLLTIAGGVVYGTTGHYLAQQEKSRYDEIVIGEQVLTARVPIDPLPPDGLDRVVEEQYAQLIQQQGRMFVDERGGEFEVKQEVRQRLLGGWKSVAPYGYQGFRQVYRFEGLDRAQEGGRTLQVQYKIRGSGVPNNVARLNWYANGLLVNDTQDRAPVEAPLDARLSLIIPTDVVDGEGRIELMVENVTVGNASIKFVGDDGLQLYYEVGGFGPNFARALLVMWVKLAFAAAVGLTFSTFLGFPVAVLCTMLVYLVAEHAGYIIDATYWYPKGTETNPVKQVIAWIGYGFAWLFQLFGDLKPTRRVVDGLYISWREVGTIVLFVGLFYTGLTGLLGWLVFNRRELARVQV